MAAELNNSVGPSLYGDSTAERCAHPGAFCVKSMHRGLIIKYTYDLSIGPTAVASTGIVQL